MDIDPHVTFFSQVPFILLFCFHLFKSNVIKSKLALSFYYFWNIYLFSNISMSLECRRILLHALESSKFSNFFIFIFIFHAFWNPPMHLQFYFFLKIGEINQKIGAYMCNNILSYFNFIKLADFGLNLTFHYLTWVKYFLF